MPLPHSTYWLLLLAGLGNAPSASAQTPQTVKAGDFATLMAAFKAICVEPGADATAQIAKAKAEPWALPLRGGNEEAGDAFGRLYNDAPLQVSIKSSGKWPNCTTLTVLPFDTTLETAEAASTDGLGLKNAKVDERRSQIDWPDALADKRWVTFSLKKTSEMTVGIFAAFDPRGR